MIKRALFLSIMIVSIFHFAYATELLKKQAMDYFQEGAKLQKGADYNGAEVFYQKALLIDPANTDLQKFIFNNRGAMYAKMGDLDKAVEVLNAALAVDPDYKSAQSNLALICDKRCTRLESLEYWAKVFEIEKKKPQDFIVEAEEDKPVSRRKFWQLQE